MRDDVSGVLFNPNHKRESAAREALLGLRWLAFAVALCLALVLLKVGEAVAARTLAMELADGWGWVIFAVWLAASAIALYGFYRMSVALDSAVWTGAPAALFMLTPVLGILSLLGMMAMSVVMAVMAFDLVRIAGFRFSLFGPPRRFLPPALPPQ